MNKRSARIAILALSAALAASNGLALGYGAMPESTTFGQALDLSVPLRAEPASPPPGCVKAEVTLGERSIPTAKLQLSLEGDVARADQRVRLRSPVVVLDPTVAVQISVGCDAPVTRRFVVFAGPPDLRSQAVQTAWVATPLTPRAATALQARAATAEPPVRPPRAPAQTPAGGASVATTKTKTAAPATPAAEASQRTAVAMPRLKLEEPDLSSATRTATTAPQHAEATVAAHTLGAVQAAAVAAEAHVAGLEQQLQALRADVEARSAAMAQMRTRLAEVEEHDRLTWLLALATAVLGALAAWLGLRLGALRGKRGVLWSQAAPAPPAPHITVPPEPVMPLVATPAAAEVAGSEAQAEAEQYPAAASHAVSVDDIIDLEQQVEFFVVLNEAEAAVRLLMSHLRGSGGFCPLPYLTLLEIHRSGGDRVAYQRLSRRFSQRFSVVAPDWEADPAHGRELQDYPGAVARLQAAWDSPPDAMAELENLLLRTDGGELFDLPAYRDVLSLYAVARDLHRLAARQDVDLLLPLGRGYVPAITARAPIFDPSAPAPGDHAALIQARPFARVDLDLSESGTAPDPAVARR